VATRQSKNRFGERKMENIGETLVGDYLKVKYECDFVAFNVSTVDPIGEIDVVGINSKKKEIYICEVATHLVTGLRYVNSKEKISDNVGRFVKKFKNNIAYAKKYFPEYTQQFMLWSPIVKDPKTGTKFNQTKDIDEIVTELLKQFQVNIEVFSNKRYMDCLIELREYARKETKELKSPVLRLFQIEEKLSEHLKKLS
jgi:Holliday junction resolvase-like predicted endonuclease